MTTFGPQHSLFGKAEPLENDGKPHPPIDGAIRKHIRRRHFFTVRNPRNFNGDENATWDGMATNYALGRQSQLPSENFYKQPQTPNT